MIVRRGPYVDRRSRYGSYRSVGYGDFVTDFMNLGTKSLEVVGDIFTAGSKSQAAQAQAQAQALAAQAASRAETMKTVATVGAVGVGALALVVVVVGKALKR